MKLERILQGLRVAQAAVTERWPQKVQKTLENQFCCIYLLVMPKYWGKQIFTHGSFPEVGQKQKTEGKKEKIQRRKTESW